jgi:pyridoxamine 5'-phosphate oxidase
MASAADPVALFRALFARAAAAEKGDPTAFALATADASGTPSVRMVLLKGVDERGFTFFTNYDSRKARELEANPRAALCFYWPSIDAQVRVEGTVERVSERESDAYFATRPQGAQAAARGSRQSAPIGSRDELEDAAHRAGPGERPDWWGGFLLRPQSYEFWQHREDRLHDRLRYRPANGGWTIERLSP